MIIHRIRIVCLLLGIALTFGGGMAYRAMAQSEDAWSSPENVSQSGSAIEPVLAVDATGGFHVIWQDPSLGFLYSQGDGQIWSDSSPLRLPFTEPIFSLPTIDGFEGFYTPQLVIDSEGLLHGFWINESHNLLYSRAPLATIADRTSWTTPVTLSETAAGLDVIIGENGRFHLAYIRPQQTTEYPVGVYYRSSDSGGANWDDAISLYHSKYLSVSSNKAHVTVSAAGETVLLGWDDPLLDSVFIARSVDGGASWTDPVIIDSRTPEDGLETTGPSQIEVIIIEETVHLTWQAEHVAGRCSQFHQWSHDWGETWQPATTLIGETPFECPSEGRFIPGNDNLLFLMTTFSNSTYFQAWDGEQWSEPEVQQSLVYFANPITYRQVAFNCQQTTVTSDNHLFVIGCGQGNYSDVWSLTRPLGTLVDWFPDLEARNWNLPDILFESELVVKSPTLVPDATGNLHTFWIEMDTADGEIVENKLYHTHWDGSSWSRPAPVIILQTEMADQLAVISLQTGHLLVTWYDPTTDTYFWRQVEAESVRSPGDWSSLQPLPVPSEIFSHPSLLTGHNDDLYLTYAVPFNEERGIYEIHSENGGISWTDPTTIVDAVAQEWAMVGRPFLGQTTNGQLHAIWTEMNLQPAPTAAALYYAHTTEDGQNWKEPFQVAEGDVRWSRLSSTGEGDILIIWQEASGNETELWSVQSFDGGESWEQPFLFRFLGKPVSSPAVITDQAGQLYLIQLLENLEKSLILQEWAQSDDGWRINASDPLRMSLQKRMITNMASGIALENRMFTIFSDARTVSDEAGDGTIENIYVTFREFVLPPIIPATAGMSDPIQTPPPMPTVIVETNAEEQEAGVLELEDTVTVTPEVAPQTNTNTNTNTSTGFLSSASTLARVGFGIVPAVLIIIVFFAWGLRRANRTR